MGVKKRRERVGAADRSSGCQELPQAIMGGGENEQSKQGVVEGEVYL